MPNPTENTPQRNQLVSTAKIKELEKLRDTMEQCLKQFKEQWSKNEIEWLQLCNATRAETIKNDIIESKKTKPQFKDVTELNSIPIAINVEPTTSKCDQEEEDD